MEEEYIDLENLDLVKKELIEKKYLIKRRAGIITLSLSISFILFGTIALSYGSFACLFFYIPGAIGIFSFDGTLIDADQNKVRIFSSILGYKYGRWYNLEDFSFVLVSASSTIGKTGLESIAHLIYLYSKNRDKQSNLLIASYSDREKTIENAHKIGELINFRVKINKFN